jgi:hydroxymethylpyrimidine/phosphomethylpyrimidine kinase
MEKKYSRVLTIAGSDSSGGAGIQADLKTISAIGCYGMSAITALTAQNTLGVTGIHPVPPDFIEAQIEAVLTDIGADAVKIGMLFSDTIIAAVARQLKKHAAKNIVLDPVMLAQSGDALLQNEAVSAIKTSLMPLAKVVTPNLPEAAVLLGKAPDAPLDVREAAETLARYGSKNILIKGGHMTGNTCTDLLYVSDSGEFIELTEKRVHTQNNHGTGCTLSSAIAAYLARGDDIETAVRNAKQYIHEAIQAGAAYQIGGGHGPVDHFYKFRDRFNLKQ